MSSARVQKIRVVMTTVVIFTLLGCRCEKVGEESKKWNGEELGRWDEGSAGLPSGKVVEEKVEEKVGGNGQEGPMGCTTKVPAVIVAQKNGSDDDSMIGVAHEEGGEEIGRMCVRNLNCTQCMSVEECVFAIALPVISESASVCVAVGTDLESLHNHVLYNWVATHSMDCVDQPDFDENWMGEPVIGQGVTDPMAQHTQELLLSRRAEIYDHELRPVSVGTLVPVPLVAATTTTTYTRMATQTAMSKVADDEAWEKVDLGLGRRMADKWNKVEVTAPTEGGVTIETSVDDRVFQSTTGPTHDGDHFVPTPGPVNDTVSEVDEKTTTDVMVTTLVDLDSTELDMETIDLVETTPSGVGDIGLGAVSHSTRKIDRMIFIFLGSMAGFLLFCGLSTCIMYKLVKRRVAPLANGELEEGQEMDILGGKGTAV